MADSGAVRRAGGGDSGRLLVLRGVDPGPRRPGDTHIIDFGTGADSRFDAACDGDSGAPTRTGTRGAACGEPAVPVTLWKHQLHTVESGE
jgi:hypothetical protein